MYTSSFFRTFSAATRSLLAVPQIGDREVNLRIILRLFCIHHFVVINSQLLNCARSFDGVILGPKEGKRGESVLENIF